MESQSNKPSDLATTDNRESLPDFVRQAEEGQLRKRRTSNDIKVEGDPIGLAFSGGGIRSATFNLGMLQSLSRNGYLFKFDYLSTVSGGGYIGGWFVVSLLRLGRDRVLNGGGAAIRHLRRYGRYLAPRGGIFSADYWVLLATYLRNLFLNQLVLLPATVAVLLFSRIAMLAAFYSPVRSADALYYLGASAGLIILASFVAFLIGGFTRSRQQGSVPAPSSLGAMTIWALSIAPLGLFSLLYCLVLSPGTDCLVLSPGTEKKEYFENFHFLTSMGGVIEHAQSEGMSASAAGIFGLVGMILVGGAYLLAVIVLWTWRRFGRRNGGVRSGREGFWRSLGLVSLCSFCAFLTGSLLYGVSWFLVSFYSPALGKPLEYTHASASAAMGTFGPPLVLGVFVTGAYLGSAVPKYWLTEGAREWWSSFCGRLIAVGFVWVSVNLVSLYATPLVLWAGPLAKAALCTTWLGAIVGGVSAGGRGNPEEKDSRLMRLRELTVRATPHIFVGGLLVAISIAIHYVTDQPPTMDAGDPSVFPRYQEPVIPSLTISESQEVADGLRKRVVVTEKVIKKIPDEQSALLQQYWIGIVNDHGGWRATSPYVLDSKAFSRLRNDKALGCDDPIDPSALQDVRLTLEEFFWQSPRPKPMPMHADEFFSTLDKAEKKNPNIKLFKRKILLCALGDRFVEIRSDTLPKLHKQMLQEDELRKLEPMLDTPMPAGEFLCKLRRLLGHDKSEDRLFRRINDTLKTKVERPAMLNGIATGDLDKVIGASNKINPQAKMDVDALKDLNTTWSRNQKSEFDIMRAVLSVASSGRSAALDRKRLSDTLLIIACIAVWLILASCVVDVNLFSLNTLYGNRLVRCYLGASRSQRSPNPVTGFDPDDDLGLSSLVQTQDYNGPYLLMNTALNVAGTEVLELQDRKAYSFVLSPLYCGSTVTGYRRTDEIWGGWASVGRGMTLSGAAVSPNMGYHSSPAVTVLLTAFNARLGAWVGNPRSRLSWRSRSPWFGFFYLLRELFGWTSESSGFVYLSDGGHYDNLGMFELLKRKCRLIVVTDVGEDGQLRCYDLASLVRKARIDLGVQVELDVHKLRSDAGKPCEHFVIGDIVYPDGVKGKVVFIKPVLTGDEPVDVANYAAENSSFPHESTSDQFFSEAQFESYRMLGEHVGDALCQDSTFKGLW